MVEEKKTVKITVTALELEAIRVAAAGEPISTHLRRQLGLGALEQAPKGGRREGAGRPKKEERNK